MNTVLCAKFVQIGEIAWEQHEKSRFSPFCALAKKKTEAEMSVAYIMRFSTIQGRHGYKVFECATKYVRLGATFFVPPPTGAMEVKLARRIQHF